MDDRPNDASSPTIGGKAATLKAEEMQSQTASTPPSYPGGLTEAFLVMALMSSIFLVGLDMVTK
jgi:hypothetical protein